MNFSLTKVIIPKIDLTLKPEFYNAISQGQNLTVENEITTAYKGLSETMFEVLLNVKLFDPNKLFYMEVGCVGIFNITAVPDVETLRYILNVNCCATLFPYVRQKVSSITGDAGMNAVYLDAYNFAARYKQTKNK